MHKSYVLLALVALTGCSSSSGVLPMGPDTYSVSASEHNMSGGAPVAQATALREANDYCAQRGKELLVTNASTSFSRPFFSYEATFRCLQPGDPALTRPAYRQAPDVIIESR